MLQSVQNALYIFETVAKCEPIGLSELARRCHMGKSSVQRYLQTLHACGWIKSDENTSLTRWGITSKAFSLGQRVTEQGKLREIAMPVMGELWSIIGESITIAVAEGDKAVLLDRYESPNSMYMQVPRGAWAPMHVVASGKVMLAFSDKKTVDDYLAKGLPPMTEKTITDAKEMRKELAQIRRNGWAVSIEEMLPGSSALAAPIFGWNGVLVATLVVTMPTVRLDLDMRKKCISLLVEAAKKISDKLRK